MLLDNLTVNFLLDNIGTTDRKEWSKKKKAQDVLPFADEAWAGETSCALLFYASLFYLSQLRREIIYLLKEALQVRRRKISVHFLTHTCTDYLKYLSDMKNKNWTQSPRLCIGASVSVHASIDHLLKTLFKTIAWIMKTTSYGVMHHRLIQQWAFFLQTAQSHASHGFTLGMHCPTFDFNGSKIISRTQQWCVGYWISTVEDDWALLAEDCLQMTSGMPLTTT